MLAKIAAKGPPRGGAQCTGLVDLTLVAETFGELKEWLTKLELMRGV